MHWAYNVKKTLRAIYFIYFRDFHSRDFSVPTCTYDAYQPWCMSFRFPFNKPREAFISPISSHLISSYLIGTQFRLNGARSKACQFKAASTNHTRLHHLPVLRSDDELGCFRAGSDKMRSDGMSDINAPESTAQ